MEITNGNLITGYIPGSALENAGVPSNGTSAVDTITIGGAPAAGDTFQLTHDGYTTAQIAWSATNATLVANILAALLALPNVLSGSFAVAVGTMTAGVGTITVTYASSLAHKAVTALTLASTTLAGGSTGTYAVANTTAGVSATGRGFGKGTLLADTTNGVLYVNQGTAYSPSWVDVADQG